MGYMFYVIMAIIFFSSCQKHIDQTAFDSLTENDKRQKLVDIAYSFYGQKRIRAQTTSYPNDCSGYVLAVLDLAGFESVDRASILNIKGNGVRLIFDFVNQSGDVYKEGPKPGDLVFFSNTLDKNKDRKINDAFTHVGIITDIHGDGTAEFLHHFQNKVRRAHLNLEKLTHKKNHKEINTFLRRTSKHDGKNTPQLAGQLVEAFGSFVLKNIEM